MRTIIVDDYQSGQKIEKFLFKILPLAPKSFIYKTLRKKNVKINKGVAKGGETLNSGDEINIFLSEEVLNGFSKEISLPQVEIKFNIIYENQDILIVDKPPGVAVQRDMNHKNNSLNDMALFYLSKGRNYNGFKPSVCNRLDLNTSGLVAVGKSYAGAKELAELFSKRKTKKTYLAIVCGNLKGEGKLEGFITKKNSEKVEFSFDKGDYTAALKYRVLDNINDVTLVSIQLLTGRKHQIRATFNAIGHPVLGDPLYGDKSFNKKYGAKFQLLHCYQLQFDSDKDFIPKKVFEAPIPEGLGKIINSYK